MIKFCVLCALLVASVVGQKNCVVPFSSSEHWDVFWPLIFKESGSLYPTEIVNGGEAVLVPASEKVIVSCAPNFLKKQNNVKHPLTNVVVTCNDGEFESDALELRNIKDYGCDLRAVESVLNPVHGCPAHGMNVHFGFVHPVDGMARMTGEACYNTKEGRTLYAHVGFGSEDAAPLRVVNATHFSQPNPPSGYKTQFMKAFRLDEVNTRLTTLLKTENIPSLKMVNFIDDNLLWSPQLAATKKLEWNYFITHENLFNLDLLKEDIHDIGQNVAIYVGTHGVYTAKNSAGANVPIFLDGDRFPVPAIVWLAVKREQSATAFVVFNDPNITENEVETSSLCNSKCDQISWLKRVKKSGAILCCEYNDLRKNIPEMPPYDIKRMLV